MKVLFMDASVCPECKSKKIKFNRKRAEFICRSCGFVLMDNIPVIEARYGKADRVLVSSKKKKVAIVIKGILRSHTEKKMLPFYAEIKKFSLPKYLEAEVLKHSKKAVEKKLTMSYSKLEILSSLIYHVCKRENIPVMIKDLTKKYRTKKKRILRCLKFLVKELGLKNTFVPSVENYIIRIASDIGYNGKLATNAIKLSKKIKIVHPLVKAAVSVWFAGKEMNLKITKKELAKFSDISYAALRKNIKRTGKKI